MDPVIGLPIASFMIAYYLLKFGVEYPLNTFLLHDTHCFLID
ncbi:hypothetical protein Lalb_Chr15g0081181 [Lupinus albus]|uniref:Uncharacterized protein n=1 Tax=Lupinus albus TaxID=3870 RepID=A0A6A4P6L5_LUPAL|nr:hypothetical protein Lalb_Chr15g0081181 [Lupinus albus]